jgi:predicted nucleic acid-binding protein
MTAMFDSSVFDELIRPEYQGLLNLLQEAKLEVLITHVQKDELAKISDPDKKRAVLSLVKWISRKVPTQGFVLGSVDASKKGFEGSRFGEAAFGSADEFDDFLEGKINKSAHAADALIALTAKEHADFLVAVEPDLLNTARRNGIRVVPLSELEEVVRSKID